jgi:hypothetical protein
LPKNWEMASLQQIPPKSDTELSARDERAPQVIYVPTAPAQRQSLGQHLVTALLVSVLLVLLAVLLAALLMFSSFLGWGGSAVAGAEGRASETVRSAADTLSRAGQEARDRLDPSHPPRAALDYDPEIEEFLRLGVGERLPGNGQRVFSIASVKSRPDAERPQLSRYVVIHSELRQPNETRVLGVTVRRDAEPRDDYLYQGEAFRLGGQVYKVNWISAERQQLAIIQLRTPDRADLPLKFVYD